MNRNSILDLRWLYVLAICAVILGGIFRLYNLDSKICWLDESYTLLRISGFTVEEILTEASTGHISRVGDLLQFQKLNKEKDAASTIYASAIEDPHIPPLYYLLERTWCSLFGDSVTAVRGLSVIFSLICLPLVWLMAIELFGNKSVAAIATTIMALSPIQVLYAQEARPYSLWCLAILCMSISCLKALKMGKPWWLIYALSAGLALWIHPLSLLVLAANAAYVCILSVKNNNVDKLSSFALSSVIGLLIFSPWIYVMVTQLETIKARTSWTAVKASNQADWLFDLAYPFIDMPTTEFFAILAVAIPLMQLFAIGAFLFTKQRRPFLFIACLGLIPTLSLLAPDFFLGGMRSFIPRYLFPLYLSLVLSLAYVIGASLASTRRWLNVFGILLTVIFLSIAIRSDWLMLNEKTWWNKEHSNYLIPIAETINKAKNPYLFSQAGVGTMLVMSHLLRPEIPVTLLSVQHLDKLPTDASDIYLLNPTPQFLLQLKAKNICNMTVQDSIGHLWKLEAK